MTAVGVPPVPVGAAETRTGTGLPERLNACEYLLDRRLQAGDGGRVALQVRGGATLTYRELAARVAQVAGALRALGVRPEERVPLALLDGVEFVASFLGALRVGAVPVPMSTMLTGAELAFQCADARARVAVASAALGPALAEMTEGAAELADLVLAGDAPVVIPATVRTHRFDDWTEAPSSWEAAAAYQTWPDSPAFWLYTSGTTGKPKAAMHRHGSVQVVCETYGARVLGIRPGDRCLSAAQVGATLFFAGPTFFANMLRAELPSSAMAGIRLAVSAGEALPAVLYERWTSHFGVDILDGIGMTEMLHIFLSNHEGQVRPGTTGVAVPGYELKILDEAGAPVPPGTPGTLYVRGSSAATGYWSRYDASRQVFQGEWLRTGDTYVADADGYYACLGRTGDMLKVSGMWVSPAEVERRLLAHPAVTQAIVVAGRDGDGLEKPVAYVILGPGTPAAEDELIQFCRDGLPGFKRPRRVVFTDGYPTTATGKVRRVELRQMATELLAGSGPATGAA